MQLKGILNLRHFFWIIALSVLVVASGCNNTRFLSEGEYLLVKNDIKYTNEGNAKDKRKIRDDLRVIPIPETNTKFLGLFKTRLWFYNVASRPNKDITKFRRWMQENVGEAPVYYDPENQERSEELIRNYLANKGYFYNTVSSDTIRKKKRMKVVYNITTKDYYRVNAIQYPADLSNPINKIIHDNKRGVLIKAGDPFDATVLKNERDRITNNLRNEGYFFFTKDYISFLLDSNKLDKSLNVLITINQPSDSTRHETYKLNKIYIYPNYTVQSFLDYENFDTLIIGEYHLVYDQLNYKTKTLLDPIRLKKDSLYRREDYSKTVQGLVQMGVFKFVNVTFGVSSYADRTLDAFIYLTPSKKQSMSVEVNANHNFEGFTGTAVSFTYRNKNLSGSADQLVFNTTAGLEFQFNKDLPPVNTADVVVDLNYYMNRYLVPFKRLWKDKGLVPKTRVGLRYSYEKRLGFYALHSTNLSFGYEWNTLNNRRHIFNPIVINMVLIAEESAEFEQRLQEIPSLRNNFQEQLIPGASYTFIYSRPASNKKPNSMFFSGTIETAGNFVHLFGSLANVNSDKPLPYKIFQRPYSQFFKITGDIRHYWKVRGNSTLVTRFTAGIGVPYGNVNFLPYVKQFYVGGTNSIRAFPIRSIGPGTYDDTDAEESGFFEDQTGDLKFEVNAEYRFNIFKFIKGGLFLDAGNIWLIKEDPERPGGQFLINNFYEGIALGGGFGVRLDFNYFVMRLDIAYPFRNPELAPDRRWVIKDLKLSDRVFNLGIGYPF